MFKSVVMADNQGARWVVRLLAALVVGGAGAVAAAFLFGDFRPVVLAGGGAIGAVLGAIFGFKALEALTSL